MNEARPPVDISQADFYRDTLGTAIKESSKAIQEHFKQQPNSDALMTALVWHVGSLIAQVPHRNNRRLVLKGVEKLLRADVAGKGR